MIHVKALEAGQSSQGTSEPITPVCQVRMSDTETTENLFDAPGISETTNPIQDVLNEACSESCVLCSQPK